MSFGARAEIRPDALIANFERLRAAVPGSRTLAAVKANAYGHGLVTIARLLLDADALAVARLCEARTLRRASVAQRIVLMGGVLDAGELDEAIDLNCDLVLHSAYQVALLESSARRVHRAWLKVDTGMRRLGVYPDAVPGLLVRLQSTGRIEHVGILSHLANADDRADAATLDQLDCFGEILDGFDGDVSLANSALLLGWRDHAQAARFRLSPERLWVRPGVSLYGVSPLVDASAVELGLEPVMNFDTQLIAVKPIRAGDRVGYGGTWRAPADSVLGIAAAGYGDGYPRLMPSGTPVLVGGRRASLAGVVSMDLIAIDLGAGAEDRPGDAVRLWGEGLPVEEIAAFAGTTSYALVTGVRDRDGRLI